MSNVIKVNFLKRQRNSILGLSLDGSRLEGVVLRRANGAFQVQKSFSASLSLDPLTAAPELVGREIRNNLDAAGINERHCIIGLPLKWALTTHCELPDLPDADLQSLLQLEAEKGFPSDVSTLLIGSSRSKTQSGKQHATLVAIPRNHLGILESALRAAKLKPVSFGLGITALQPPENQAPAGVLALAIGEGQVGLLITSGGGVAALRALEGTIEAEGGLRKLHADVVAREVRITVGQLPAEMRDSLKLIRVFGPSDLANQLANELGQQSTSFGQKIEVVSRYKGDEFGAQIATDTPVSPAHSLAARNLAGWTPAFELLPPRVKAWQAIAGKYSSGKFRIIGAAAILIALGVASAFAYQQWQYNKLRTQWAKIAPDVADLQKVQQKIRQFRPWYDDSVGALSILRQVTTAFPEEGVVSAKTVEIRDLNLVTCTGTARDNQALLKTLDRLSATPGVSELHRQTRGKSPIQFTFDFHWAEGTRPN